jgi:hypothetical protein
MSDITGPQPEYAIDIASSLDASSSKAVINKVAGLATEAEGAPPLKTRRVITPPSSPLKDKRTENIFGSKDNETDEGSKGKLDRPAPELERIGTSAILPAVPVLADDEALKGRAVPFTTYIRKDEDPSHQQQDAAYSPSTHAGTPPTSIKKFAGWIKAGSSQTEERQENHVESEDDDEEEENERRHVISTQAQASRGPPAAASQSLPLKSTSNATTVVAPASQQRRAPLANVPINIAPTATNPSVQHSSAADKRRRPGRKSK